MKNNFQNLVLLEFMVNKVEFYERDSKIDRTYLSRLGHTKVQIRLKTCCQLDVLEDENSKRYTDEKTGSSIVEFGSGKSCLLPSALLMNGQNNQACICVSRRAPEGDMKDYFTLGETRVDLCTLFKALVRSNSCSPSVKSQRGEYDLRDGQDTKVGSVDVFIRATDLGKNIVTMFQMGAGESSFYFKGTDASPLEEEESAPCFVCPESSAPATAEKWFSPRQGYAPAFPQPLPYAYGQQPSAFPPQNVYQPQYNEGITFSQPPPQARPWGGRPKPVMSARGGGGGGGGGVAAAVGGGGGGGGMSAPGFAKPGSPCAQIAGGMAGGGYGQQQMVQYRDEDYEKLDGDYKEIAAEVNGYEVKIKLLRRPKKAKE